MKTILSRLKTATLNKAIAGQTLSYVKHVEIVHPDLLMSVFSISTLPMIVYTPESTAEAWSAVQRKTAEHIVIAYLILSYNQREASIMGDATRPGGHGKGIMDFVNDFLEIFRGHRLAVDGNNYLDKPLDIQNINYIREDLGNNASILIAEIKLFATRNFTQLTLPGDV